jgi:3,4-dihydroxy 2-butanone 4-phosphate synthase/GTP cyclohydrolase II
MSPISEILNDFKLGNFVILVDDEGRENEGDLVIAAEFITAQHINFMATYGRGLICLAMTAGQIEKLKIPMMRSSEHKNSKTETAFTMSIEASRGVTTGISAADRALTIQTAVRELAVPSDIVVPGHIFPLRANVDGVLGRAGHTEAAVDLAQIAKLNPSAVICEIINADGTMSRVPDLLQFSKMHNIKIGTIESLINYRKQL